ncbi:MAG: hypothetical protein JXQ23_08340 [Clostridia bacterium]|nr:hypothetical protein [Clostridia bacterium]
MKTKKISLKKIYIILAVVAGAILILNLAALLVKNSSNQNEYRKEVKLIESSIDKNDAVTAINTYNTIKDSILIDSDSYSRIESAVNKSFHDFISVVSSTGVTEQPSLQIFRNFYDFILDSTIENELSALYDSYLEDTLTYNNYMLALASLDTVSQSKAETSSIKELIKTIRDSRLDYNLAMEKFDAVNYEEAIDLFRKVIPADPLYYEKAKEKIEDSIKLLKEQILNQSSSLANQGFYLNAYQILNSHISYFENDDDVMLTMKYYKSLEPELELYDGPVYQVFFHSLIIYPELAFDGDYEDEGYYKYMTTTLEFKRMLEKFYEDNFILIDINLLIDTKTSGQSTLVSKADLMIPKGKKPLIISVDDVSYYNYMDGDGFADKLVLDENGEVATLVKTPENNLVVTRDGDVIPILDDFVKTHPDFSFNGAKGIIALTGYEGIFGYETHLTESSNYDAEFQQAAIIADKLKESGWLFANHSYTHNNYFKDLTINMEQLTYDTEKWELQVGAIVGKTNIYISPFGYIFPVTDERFKYITEKKGYYIYCPVGGTGTIKYNDKSLVMYRINLDGKTLKINTQLTAPFFDASEILDERRPTYIW